MPKNKKYLTYIGVTTNSHNLECLIIEFEGVNGGACACAFKKGQSVKDTIHNFKEIIKTLEEVDINDSVQENTNIKSS